MCDFCAQEKLPKTTARVQRRRAVTRTPLPLCGVGDSSKPPVSTGLPPCSQQDHHVVDTQTHSMRHPTLEKIAPQYEERREKRPRSPEYKRQVPRAVPASERQKAAHDSQSLRWGQSQRAPTGAGLDCADTRLGGVRVRTDEAGHPRGPHLSGHSRLGAAAEPRTQHSGQPPARGAEPSPGSSELRNPGPVDSSTVSICAVNPPHTDRAPDWTGAPTWYQSTTITLH